MKSPLRVAKIVSNASDSAWCQAYNAGGLFAVISLTRKDAQDLPQKALSPAGRDMVSALEAEFFSLEEKNLKTITAAVETVIEKSPKDITVTLLVAAVVQNVLYGAVTGCGRLLMLRKKTLGTLLSTESPEKGTQSGSGFLENGDIFILETESFANTISSKTWLSSLDQNNPEEASEILSPQIHETQDGSSCSMIVAYERQPEEEIEVLPTPQQEVQLPEPEEIHIKKQKTPIRIPQLSLPFSLSPVRIVILISALLIAGVLILGVIHTLKSHGEAKTKAAFDSIYNPAKAKYDEGHSLQDLNKTIAQDDFSKAKTILENGRSKLPPSSPEEKQILTLLNTVNDSLNSLTIGKATAKQVDLSSDPILAFASKHDSNPDIAQDDTNFYVADATGITQANKKTDKEKQIIQNSSSWKELGGFGTYLGNMYVADRKDGIIKYVPVGSNFSKSAYFSSGSSVDLSQAQSLAIDGSLWILTKSGQINKFTKGNQDNFSISGLTTPFSGPTQIFTTVDGNNLYILDSANSRVVVLSKNGAFQIAYVADAFKNASIIDVLEGDKKIYALSGNTLWEIDMK